MLASKRRYLELLTNLNALCRPHHILKTLYGYRLERDDTGEWLLITPTGEIVASSHSRIPDLIAGAHPPGG
jgi:hypothetical protein